jgi:hypothetical protein
MVLILPVLLSLSSPQKLTGLHLSLPGSSEALPPEPTGQVEHLEVRRQEGRFAITADVRRTDVLAAAGQTERKSFEAADVEGLWGVLEQIKAMDPKRERLTLIPAPDSRAEDVVHWMDVVKSSPRGELYPRVILKSEHP